MRFKAFVFLHFTLYTIFIRSLQHTTVKLYNSLEWLEINGSESFFRNETNPHSNTLILTAPV